MRQCSSTLKKMTLELGGNGCWVVFGDADLEKAASGKLFMTL
jgi:acyl-CoA reductase-like NAD-dependent aldehyde dehydrogenase